MAAQITTTTPVIVGGMTVPWASLRTLLPDDRWAVWAAGWLNSPVSVTLGINYEGDDSTLYVLGQQTFPAQAWGKVQIGPYAAKGALAPPTMPAENIISLNLFGSLASAGTAFVERWTLWVRMTPRHV